MAEGYLNLDLLTKPQRVALGLAGDAFRALDRTVRAGTAAPEEIARQLNGVFEAMGGLAAATAQPLQDFVVRQRQLAETVANLADAQSDLADLFASLAQRQAEVAAALEKVTAPALGLMGATQEPRSTSGSAKAHAKKATTKKTPSKKKSG